MQYTNWPQVLGEIGRPRKAMPWGTSVGVAIVCVLYLLVNVAYVSGSHAHPIAVFPMLTS